MTLSSNQLQASIPALTIMQFEPGDISSSVNLFRGNLAFPLKLLTLPGRGESSVNVTLLYQSQTDPFVDEWNHSAPTDVAGLGWSCEFSYQNKTYDTTSLEAPKEYVIPELDPTLPPETPTAWQSPLKTLYLDSIAIHNDQGQLQATVCFDYYPLTNLTVRDPSNLLAYGATYKRYLKSIREVLPNGKSLPGTQFEYEWDLSDSKNRGALTQIMYPKGSITRFTYEQMEVGAKDGDEPGARNLTIANPFGDNIDDYPRVWYGTNYVVCGWFNNRLNAMRLNVYTWVGRWAPTYEQWLEIDVSVNLDKIQVAASDNSFILTLPNYNNTETKLYRFHRHPAANATWIASTIDGGDLEVNTYSTGSITLVQGDDFYLVTDNDNMLCDRYVWNWIAHNWEVEHLADKSSLCPSGTSYNYTYYTAARGNVYLLFCYDRLNAKGKISLYWRDRVLTWNQGGTLEVTSEEIDIHWDGTNSYFQMTAGPGYAAMAFITAFHGSPEITEFDYRMAVLSWDTEYNNLTLEELPDVFGGETFNYIPINIMYYLGPTVTSAGALIGSGPNLFLYDGQSWSFQTMGITYKGFSDPSIQYYWYSYSDTAAIKTENTISGIVSNLHSFDPSQPEAGWSSQELQRVEPAPEERYRLGFSTLFQGVAGQNLSLYPRSVWPQWNDVPRELEAELVGEGIDTITIINQAPNFLTYMTVDEEGVPIDTRIIFFHNGGVVRGDDGEPVVEIFAGQQMFRFLNNTYNYQTALSGKQPAIPDGFITYPVGSTLDLANQITLHRYANGSVQAPIRSWL